MSSNKDASQVTAYSFKPFIDLTSEEAKRLSPMTRNARQVIYVKGFLANTKMNKNNFRITDNKYIGQNKGIAAGRSLNFGPKMLGKAHHPNFYRDLDLSHNDPEKARKQFLEYQEWSRIGDILRIDYDNMKDQWDFYGAISHPNIVEAVQNRELELPKFVSPYFWNLNDPDDTGPEIREAELFHVSFVDDPAYGVEVAKVEALCNSSEGDSCAAKVFGMPAGKIQKVESNKGIPKCMCGLMASYNHKLDSSFYIQTPKEARNNMTMNNSDNSTSNPATVTTTTTTPPPTAQPVSIIEQQQQGEEARNAALDKMKEYDKMANEGKVNLEDNTTTNNIKDNSKNPTIPVEFQDLVNIQIEKERKAIGKQHEKVISEYVAKIETLEKEIAKRDEAERDNILDRYIQKDMYKEEETYNERRKFYKELAQELKMPNSKLEELMKDHYQVKELKISLAANNNKEKGKGAAAAADSNNKTKNMDPFGFAESDGFGLLSSGRVKGLGASTSEEEEEPQQQDDRDSQQPADGTEEEQQPREGVAEEARAILKAF